MEYLLMMATDASAPPYRPTGAELLDWLADLERRGADVKGDRLRPVEDATTVRRRGDETIVTDGPFAESKEWIAGYHIIEAADLDEAVEIAGRHPGAALGAIEIRPVWPIDLDWLR